MGPHLPAGRQHLLGAAHPAGLDAPGRRQVPAQHQIHPGPEVAQGPGQFHAHLPRGAVGEGAHRVQVLPGGPGGDEDAPALEAGVGGPGQGLHGVGDVQDVGELARALLPAGQEAFHRLHDGVAEALEGGHVGLHRRVRPHGLVHGRGPEHPRRGGQEQGAQQVRGQTVGGLADDVGGGGHHRRHVRPAGQVDVLDDGVGPPLVVVGVGAEAGLAREGGQGEGGDEPRPRVGQAAPDHVAALGEGAGQFRGPVRRDPPRDAQQDVHLQASITILTLDFSQFP